jgi:internalin A
MLSKLNSFFSHEEIISSPFGKSNLAYELIDLYQYNSQSQCMLVTGEWNDKKSAYIEKHNIDSLYFNVSLGWKGNDFTFLKELSSIKELKILQAYPKGVSSIENLVDLTALSITGIVDEAIDFSALTDLEYCYLDWWGGAESIFSCRNLKHFHPQKIKIKDYSVFRNLINLEHLEIVYGNFNKIDYLMELKKLQYLELSRCRNLKSLVGISCLKNLKWLHIDGIKKLDSISFVQGLNKLEVLNISNLGEISSLEPIVNMDSLRAIFMSSDTNIVDGNLSPLETLPNISLIHFANRRHYTHRCTETVLWKHFPNPAIVLEKR